MTFHKIARRGCMELIRPSYAGKRVGKEYIFCKDRGFVACCKPLCAVAVGLALAIAGRKRRPQSGPPAQAFLQVISLPPRLTSRDKIDGARHWEVEVGARHSRSHRSVCISLDLTASRISRMESLAKPREKGPESGKV